MKIKFGAIEYDTDAERQNICEIHLAGDEESRCGSTVRGKRLKYVSHTKTETELTIVQSDGELQVTSHFIKYDGTNAVRAYTEVKNISSAPVIIEYASSLMLANIGKPADSQNIFLYRFTNGTHSEIQPRKRSLFDCGLFDIKRCSAKRVYGLNCGSMSCKEQLPQLILHNAATHTFTMIEIESNVSWYWEIGHDHEKLYFAASGAESNAHWAKKLNVGETYATPYAAFATGETLDSAVGNMTVYRRKIRRENKADSSLPVIFNEYMHLSWDSPDEDRTAYMLPFVKKAGADIYVIDCGWHNEEPGEKIYPYVGQWKESKIRYPHGIKHTVDLIHSYGLKAGLWLEPEIIGTLCDEMLAYYPPDAYFYRRGKVVTANGRRFLDFRNSAVTDYLNKVIERLIEDYGVDYLKFDYNQDCGAGTELNADSFGDGLQKHTAAYFTWVENIMNKYPKLIIETCSAGGQRLDYAMLSRFSLVSTSDQIDHRKYPYIAANMQSAVCPEQAAVWCYPVDDYPNMPTSEDVIMNAVNSLLGRVHLASHIDLLNSESFALLQEGIAYYKKTAEAKKNGLPYFPLGFADFASDLCASGYISGNKLYLAVWNLSKAREVKIPLENINAVSACVAYPTSRPVPFTLEKNILAAQMPEYGARFFEINLKNK